MRDERKGRDVEQRASRPQRRRWISGRRGRGSRGGERRCGPWSGSRCDNVLLEYVLARELRAIVGDRLSLADAVREQHGRDESYHQVHAPDAVVFAADSEDVCAVVRACAQHRVPVIAFGIGTSLEGQVAAIHGGVCIDLSRMDAVLALNAQDMDVTVQAGVTCSKLNSYLRDTGLYFAVDPGADATLGGMAATRASGTNAVRYGTMRETVLGLGVVLADGRLIRTSRRARKSAAGPMPECISSAGEPMAPAASTTARAAIISRLSPCRSVPTPVQRLAPSNSRRRA